MDNHHPRIAHAKHAIKDHNVLVAGDFNRLHHNNVILNLELIGPILHIKLNPDIAYFYRLLNVYESTSKNYILTYTHDEDHKLWVDIPCDVLDLSIGVHNYTLEFVSLITGDTFFQYFGYTIQSDKPDKPYIYMNRDE